MKKENTIRFYITHQLAELEKNILQRLHEHSTIKHVESIMFDFTDISFLSQRELSIIRSLKKTIQLLHIPLSLQNISPQLSLVIIKSGGL